MYISVHFYFLFHTCFVNPFTHTRYIVSCSSDDSENFAQRFKSLLNDGFVVYLVIY